MPRMQNHPARREGWVLAALLAFGQLACGASSETGPVKGTLCTETFSACMGDPTGTWTVAGVCLDGDLAAAQNGLRSPACAMHTTGAALSATGTVMYTAAAAGADPVVIYKETMDERSTESISPACATEAYGVATLDAAGCTQVQTMLQTGDATKKVVCSLSGANCDCRITNMRPRMVQNLFTVTGSRIVESDDTAYDICITGSTMLQKQTRAGTVSSVTRLQKS